MIPFSIVFLVSVNDFLLTAIFVALACYMLAQGRIRASRNLHSGMLQRIIRAPMAFFDTTPLGRIVNRFSKDVDTVLDRCKKYFSF